MSVRVEGRLCLRIIRAPRTTKCRCAVPSFLVYHTDGVREWLTANRNGEGSGGEKWRRVGGTKKKGGRKARGRRGGEPVRVALFNSRGIVLLSILHLPLYLDPVFVQVSSK